MPKLTQAEKVAAQAVFRGEEPGKAPCQWCGGLHVRTLLASPPPGASLPPGLAYGVACPRIRKLEFHANGNLTSVTFADEWDESGVVFPEDAFDTEEEGAGG
jgi:hypothetical protein